MPLLGKASRTRRAKSANIRNSSSRSRRRLFNESESSSSDATAFENNENMKLDYATERMAQIKESLKNERGNIDLENMRPINIDVALGNEQL